ncbi:MAG TPA: 4Fe-4S binding protein, partial [Candidatus Ozemobacteraceae bacterium]|nr:4Fe-4S binding protein [Candidatus Ozemobacteraceae bacterium]
MQKTRRVYQLLFVFAAIVLTARNLRGYTKATIESWCPGGGIESLAFYVKNNAFLCAVSGLNLILFIAVTIGTLIAGRAFCSWVCPIGALHELLARAGKVLGIRRDTVWQGAGRFLGLARYPVLLLILWATMSYADLVLRPFCPYYVVMSGQEHEVAWWS